jgi:hypothetical protein
MKEVLEKLESIENKLKNIHISIGDLGSSNVQNFTILDKLIKEKIDEAKNEIIAEIKKGK